MACIIITRDAPRFVSASISLVAIFLTTLTNAISVWIFHVAYCIVLFIALVHSSSIIFCTTQEPLLSFWPNMHQAILHIKHFVTSDTKFKQVMYL